MCSNAYRLVTDTPPTGKTMDIRVDDGTASIGATVMLPEISTHWVNPEDGRMRGEQEVSITTEPPPAAEPRSHWRGDVTVLTSDYGGSPTIVSFIAAGTRAFRLTWPDSLPPATGVADAGVADGGVADGGVVDGGVVDGGVADGGVADGGAPARRRRSFTVTPTGVAFRVPEIASGTLPQEGYLLIESAAWIPSIAGCHGARSCSFLFYPRAWSVWLPATLSP
jgi:hypothetical protein